MSVAAQRRSTHAKLRQLASGLGSSANVGADRVNEAASAGFLVDYLVRCQRTIIQRRGSEHALARNITAALVKGAGSSKTSSTFAMSMLRRERLRSYMMDNIVIESKERGIYEPTPTNTLRKWANELRKTKRDMVRLRSCVQYWLLSWRLSHMVVPAEPQSMWERKGQLDEFWSVYHDRSRILSASAPLPRAASGHAQRRDKPGASTACGLKWDFDQGTSWKTMKVGRAAAKASSGKNLAPANMPKSASLPSLHKGSPKSTSEMMDEMGFGVSRPRSSRDHHTPHAQVAEPLPPILAGRQRYLQECDTRKNPPRPLPIVIGDDPTICAAGKDLVDNELQAIAAMVQEMPRLKLVDLTNNALLTDRGLVPLLKQLLRDPVKATLQQLVLSQCTRAASHTMDATIKVLRSAGGLRHLDLSRIQIPTQFQLPLCQAIGKHACLEVVNLAETGFTHQELTKQCFAALFSGKVKSVDISWNNFSGDVFEALGSFVVGASSLRALRVANCSAASDICSATDFVPPLSRFLEQLSHDHTLKLLDISMNRCDFRTALILEDSLDTHKNLKELIMANNPLGTLGMRSILRLLSRDHTGLVSFDTDGCYFGSATDNFPVFTYTNPGGKYELQLWRPYHRALLRMLYKMMEFFKLSTGEAFDKAAYKVKGQMVAWAHPSKDSIGVWQVPRQGDLSIVFTVERAILKRFMSSESGLQANDFVGFLDNYCTEMKFKPGIRKVIPLLGRYAMLKSDDHAQEVYIDSLAKDFVITLPYLEYMCALSPMHAPRLVERLLPCVPGGAPAHYLSGMLFRTVADFTKSHEKMVNFINFNVNNPTGHYKLDLANCSDYAVAEGLLLIDRWEAAVDQKCSRKDTSHRGNGSHIRNELFQGRELSNFYSSVAEWKLAEHGEFEFDYISNQRPKRTVQVLSDSLWETLLFEVYASDCDAADKIAALRSISHCFYLRTSHMRSLVGYFKNEVERADILIIFYMRIVDMHNAKMFRVRFENYHEVVALQGRLGYACFFPFMQPENAKFHLNLAVYDQRLCASMFVQLAIKEKFPQNLHDYSYRRADGTEDPMPLGVPKSWGDMATIPKEGTFRATYRCAPEDRNFSHRKDIANSFGYFDVEGLTDEDVQWWTGLTEPPEDVLNLLEYFISRYDNVEQPFLKIDGVDGNGCITLRELLDGLEEMGCRKFDVKKGSKTGRTKEQRIESIFRYLDPGGEGSVSRGEWAMLSQLWKEFDLSIREFVHFLTLTFGDDLMDAWEALDDDDSGELTEDEWQTAVCNIGYFGPAKVVFALLDTSDDGSISFDEFEVLEKYRPKRDG